MGAVRDRRGEAPPDGPVPTAGGRYSPAAVCLGGAVPAAQPLVLSGQALSLVGRNASSAGVVARGLK